MSRTVVVISDFSDDYYHGVMKGVVLKSGKPINFVDLPVNSSYDIITCSWIIMNSKSYFPDDTIFLIVVDPGVGTDRKPLLVKIGKQIFIVPDNGIMSPFKEEIDEVRIINVENPGTSTFHGRDVFAPAVKKIVSGTSLNNIGSPIEDIQQIPIDITKSSGKGVVVSIDNFGNIITSMQINQKVDKIKVKVSGIILKLKVGETFASLNQEEIGGIIGSCNTLELVMNQKSAHNHLPAISVGDTIELLDTST